MKDCQVSTYSGGRLHERPLSFTWEGERLEVRQVLKQGCTPDTLFFKVAAADGRAYLLTYHRPSDSWKASLCGPSG
jgi:hypothetical protein